MLLLPKITEVTTQQMFCLRFLRAFAPIFHLQFIFVREDAKIFFAPGYPRYTPL